MIRTFKYPAFITSKTEEKALRVLELCRILYNLCLEERILAYRYSGKSLSAFDQLYELKEFKKEFPEFKEATAHVLYNVVERLDKAYQRFFKRISKSVKSGFPRFKGVGRYHSFTLKMNGHANGWKLKGNKLHVTRVGIFHLNLHRPIEGTIKLITIKRSSTGRWWVSFVCDGVFEKLYPKTDKAVGIDVGITSFAYDTDGNRIENPRHMKTSLATLQERQRKLSRKQKGSKRRQEAKVLVAKAYDKIRNQRIDFLHKLSKKYVEENQVIVVEDLKVQNMLKNHKLAGSIADCSWSEFFNLMSYKAEEAGRIFVKVDPRNTSQMCSVCGEIVSKDLSVRVHSCPYCNCEMDRDYNAAWNILTRGLEQLEEKDKADLDLPIKLVRQTGQSEMVENVKSRYRNSSLCTERTF